jgi:Domain of unknown function (DUF1902)
MSAESDRSPVSFTVTATWDAEAGVFYSQSDIPGLHVEAPTFDAFVALVRDLAPEMIADNLPQAKGPFAVRIEGRCDLVLSAA